MLILKQKKSFIHLLISLSRRVLPIHPAAGLNFPKGTLFNRANHCPSFPPSPCELVLSKVKDDKLTHYSSIATFQLGLPTIALAQARRAGARRTKVYIPYPDLKGISIPPILLS